MKLHSEILFLEIIKLYFKNNSNPLPLKNLENAFYTLLEKNIILILMKL